MSAAGREWAGRGRETIRRCRRLLTHGGLREWRGQGRRPPSLRPFLGGGQSRCRSSRLRPAIPSPAEKPKSHLEVPLEENLNRRVLEEGAVEARTIEDAIAVLRWGRLSRGGRGGAGRRRLGPPPVESVAGRGALLCPLALSVCGASVSTACGPRRGGRGWPQQNEQFPPLPSSDHGWGSALLLGACRAGGDLQQSWEASSPPPVWEPPAPEVLETGLQGRGVNGQGEPWVGARALGQAGWGAVRAQPPPDPAAAPPFPAAWLRSWTGTRSAG